LCEHRKAALEPGKFFAPKEWCLLRAIKAPVKMSNKLFAVLEKIFHLRKFYVILPVDLAVQKGRVDIQLMELKIEKGLY
jgi:hypothetical protein